MPGNVRRHARDLSPRDVKRFLDAVQARSRHPERDHLIACFSFYAGLRAGEIAALKWRMVLSAEDRVADALHLEDSAAKKLGGRTIPLKKDLRTALISFYEKSAPNTKRDDHIFLSDRGGPIRAQSLINWFRTEFLAIGLAGASSHSGRRYFVTMTARKITEAGGSLRDVQELAGHRALATTQLYIAQNSGAQARVVDLI